MSTFFLIVRAPRELFSLFLKATSKRSYRYNHIQDILAFFRDRNLPQAVWLRAATLRASKVAPNIGLILRDETAHFGISNLFFIS
jgi:hypothetical protein